jgi:hypothetical protein
MNNWTETTERQESNYPTIQRLSHNSDDVEIVAKDLPNGGQLRIQTSANLPGGFKVLHEESKRSFEAATDEAERYAKMYNQEGTVLIRGQPLLV